MDGLNVQRVPETEKDLLWRYFQFYLYEYSEYTAKKPIDGVFLYPWFDVIWREGEQRWPFWARIRDEIAGFALVRFDDQDGCYELAEFFIVNQFRRQGVGFEFARRLLQSYKGPWKVNQARRNVRAVAFWRHVLDDLVVYTEAPLVREDGVPRIEQRFTVS